MLVYERMITMTSFVRPSSRSITVSILSLLLTLILSNQVYASSEIENNIDTLVMELSDFFGHPKVEIRVAVFPFYKENTDEVTAFSLYIQDAIITSLVADRNATVVNRYKLDKFLEERNFQQSDLIDSTKRKALGSFSEADVILLGSYWDLGYEVKVSAQLFDLRSADAIGAGKCFISKKLIRSDWLDSSFKPKPIENPIGETPVPEPVKSDTSNRSLPSDEDITYAVEELSRELKEKAKKVAQANHPASNITGISKNDVSYTKSHNGFKVTEEYKIKMRGAILGLRKFRLLIQTAGEIRIVGKSIKHKILEGNVLSDEEF